MESLKIHTRALFISIWLILGPSMVFAQSLDDIIEEQITSEVESGIVDAVEQAVEDQVGEQVEQQVQDSVADAIEQQLESSVTDSLEQQVESGVTEAIEQQLEAGVVEALEQQIESGVTGTLEQQLETVLEGGLESQIGEALERGLEAALEQRLSDELPPLPLEPLTDALGQALPGTGSDDDIQTTANDTGTLLVDIDDDGNAMEREVWVLLIPAGQVAQLDDWGFSVRSRQSLDSLGAELVTIVAPEDRTLAEAALELALDAPGTVVDLNHVYRTDADAETDATAADVTTAAASTAPAHDAPAISIGMIDTAVSIAHESLRGATIIQRDFVRFEAQRPLAHGTAVASLLVGHSAQVSGYLQGARLYAASVFLEDSDGMPAALTTALVEAVAWFAEQRVQVVNMSLSGPPNRALEAAIERAADRGLVIVAAVGNNGPHGTPLFPAAYERVVGVTAVDARHRVYRQAGRGPHVMFAAPGVRVRVARAGGTYAIDSGTSIAAPYAAALIATSLHATGNPADLVLRQHQAAAQRLGDADFDSAWGFGLITALRTAPAAARISHSR